MPDVERHEEMLDGRKLIRFDWYFTDAVGQRRLVQQLWADPQTRLPVQSREVLELAARDEQKRDAIVGRYDFPESGPASIYDIGVPRGLPIFESNAKPTDEVATILAAGGAARKRWPSCYRMLLWSYTESASIFYFDGARSARTRWFTSSLRDNDGGGFLQAGATAAQVQAWMRTTPRRPIDEIIDDGKRNFARMNNVLGQQDMADATTRVMGSPHFPDDSNFPPGTLWPYLNRAGAPVKIDPPADAPPGVVVLRLEFGDGRTEQWIDTTRDFICVKNIAQKRVAGAWKSDRVDVLEDFKQLPTGQWYAAARKFTYTPLKAGVYSSTSEEFVDVKVLDPKEIPPGTFDGEKLLKGAKVETY